MNNQQIREKLKEDGWIESKNSEMCFRKSNYAFHFLDFESHCVENVITDKDLFQGKIKTKTHYKALMGMLEI